jgi:hypothetical protein
MMTTSGTSPRHVYLNNLAILVVHESTNFSDNFGDLIIIAGSKSIDVHVCADRQYYICGKVVL